MKKNILSTLLFLAVIQISAQNSKMPHPGAYLVYDMPVIRTQQTGGAKVSGIQGVDMTNILLGITDFAIERSKMELNIAFFDRFQKFLDLNPECKTLFPNTLQQLNLIRSFQFNEFLPKLRKVFFDDLKNFPGNINTVLCLPRYQKLFKNFPEITAAIRSISAVSKLKTQNNHLNDVIYELSKVTDGCEVTNHKFLKNYSNTWKLINAISTAVVNPQTNVYYRSNVLQGIIDDDNQLSALVTAFIQEVKIEGIVFYDRNNTPIELAALLANIENKPIVFKSFFQNVANAVNDFELAKDQADSVLKHNASTEVKRQAAINYLDAAVKCVDVMGNIFSLVDGVNAEPYLNLVRGVTQITRDAIDQNYPSLVSNSIGFLESIFEMADWSNNGKDPVINEQAQVIQKGLSVLSQLLKYANFAANVVEAKTPKEVKDAIETAALPPGSSSIKKNSKFNISLQLHLGAACNFKTFDNPTTLPSWKNRFNVTLPVGVSFNTGFEKGGSLGVFLSIIDIGALAQFRISSSDTTSLSERIRFTNVLSPGVYLSYGFPYNLPLSLNFGGQFGPGLTKATASNGNTIEQPSWRLLASLTVDIPAFTIFNISKRTSSQIDFKKYDFEIGGGGKKK